MKKMVTLSKLIEAAENESLDPDITLVDAESISVLDENYLVDRDQSDFEDQDQD